MMNRLSLALLAALVCSPCLARDATLGRTTVTLTVPPGQCELDRANAGDCTCDVCRT